jgi:hypothetical protein
MVIFDSPIIRPSDPEFFRCQVRVEMVTVESATHARKEFDAVHGFGLLFLTDE